MSAINKALRSIPINIHTTIWTDSRSCIQAIDKTLSRSSNMIRTNARPYLRAIKRIIKLRTKHGYQTKINHVRSHTGLRDPASIGNSEADRLARYIGISNEESTDCGITLLQNELPYTVTISTPPINDQEDPKLQSYMVISGKN